MRSAATVHVSLILTVLAASAGVALAQPTASDGTTDGSATPPVPVEPPPPTPPASPPPARVDLRPTDLSFGIGFGYTFSTSLETPNTVTVRVRLPGGLSFEPILRVLNTSETMNPGTGTSTTSSTTELGIAGNLLFPLWKHGRTDFSIIGQIAFDTQKATPDTTVSGTNTTTTTFGIGYGIECAFWITQHWMLSLDATNPIINYSDTDNNMAGGMDMKDTTTTVGLIHDPTVSLVIHLFN
jgi:hypothetical protein